MATDKKVEKITVQVPAERHTMEFSSNDIETMIRAKMRSVHGAQAYEEIDIAKKGDSFLASYVRVKYV